MLPRWGMANHRTITLNDICCSILKEWQKDPDFNFSAWVRANMTKEYNDDVVKLNDKRFIPPSQRGKPTLSYQCDNCKVNGHHWERHCPFPSKKEQLMKLRDRARREEE